MSKMSNETKSNLLQQAKEQVEFWKSQYNNNPTKTNMKYWLMAEDTVKNYMKEK